jgi:hypothetical protein
MIRTSTLNRVDAAEPHELAFLDNAKQLGLRIHADRPISSKKIVPWSATSNSPFLAETALGKLAPRTVTERACFRANRQACFRC